MILSRLTVAILPMILAAALLIACAGGGADTKGATTPGAASQKIASPAAKSPGPAGTSPSPAAASPKALLPGAAASPFAGASPPPAPQGATVRIQQPQSGSTVDGPDVQVQVTVDGIRIAAADPNAPPNVAHLHYFVDRPVTAGPSVVAAPTPIPQEPGIIHTTDTITTLQGLQPGSHTVTVILGDGRHISFQPPISDTVTFTVR